MKVYDVIFEDEDGNCDTVKSSTNLNTAQQFIRSFKKNLPPSKTGIPYHLYILLTEDSEKHLFLVDANNPPTEFPKRVFRMVCYAKPVNHESWFPDFEPNKTFTAYNLPDAQAILDKACEEAGTKDDPLWKTKGPSAILEKDDVIDF